VQVTVKYGTGVARSDERDPRAYVRIAADIRRRITAGEYRPGMRVPSVTTLVQEHGVSRVTASHALQLLADENLIERIPGLGYYVTEDN
jgi:DNA-binding GntR family transcriptional regulator